MININDVAKAAGVSVSTVSKAINDSGKVSNKTKEKVLDIAKELDYAPSRSAVQLVKGTEDTIGVVTSALDSSFNQSEFILEILSGIYNTAQKYGMRVSVFSIKTLKESNQNYVQFCKANNLSGLIIHGFEKTDKELIYLAESQIPSVFIDIEISGIKTANVSSNNIEICEEVVRRLVGLKHENIAFVQGSISSEVYSKRLLGYKNAVSKYNLQKEYIIESNSTREDTYNKVKDYLSENPNINALFCSSDLMGVGALYACLDLGFKVPHDISIIGFDGLNFADYLRPKLSTVKQDFYGIGSTCIDMLVNILNDFDVQLNVNVPCKIEFTESVSKKI